MDSIFLYGPPGSGKSTIGRPLAEKLALPFYDLDQRVELQTGMPIPEIFAAEGEAGFRVREQQALQDILNDEPGVIALGGGALTVPETRRLAESAGLILTLTASLEALERRIASGAGQPNTPLRPLLFGGDLHQRLQDLLARRAAHYASFPLRLDTSDLNAEEALWQAQICLGRFRVEGMGAPYSVFVEPGGLDTLGVVLRSNGLKGPLALVCDENTARLYAKRAAASLQASGYGVHTVTIPAGEPTKTIQTVMQIWQGFLEAGVERSSTVLALGGGVTGDLTGFAAATYLRGVAWVNLPTSLLSMADASLGGKTGADLPQGKNLIGAFYPPKLVLADPQVLGTLPLAELRSGLAEVAKHAVISDPGLFDMLDELPIQTNSGLLTGPLTQIVRRAMAVKIRTIEIDPYEKGIRAALNLGHTVGHALELVSGFALRHGEAIAIGMVVEARLAERLGLAKIPNLSQEVARRLELLGLPTAVPAGLEHAAILSAMRVDKKRKSGRVQFALPVEIGTVLCGVEVDDALILETL